MKTLAIILLFTSSFAFAQTSASIDAGNQKLTWIGKASVGGYSPEGTLEIKQAEITYDKTAINSLSLVVDMKTMDQENKQLKTHLKDKDFFYVKKFPEATFVLSEISTIENGLATLKGKMTIRGITQDENIVATVKISEEHLKLSIDQTMDRTRYGVNHNSPSLFKKLKENAIADDFVLKGQLTFINK